MRIFLTGMPGSGKSTCGKMLAEELDYPALDLDVLIEEREGKTISAIFEQHGEDYFRQVESRLLKETVADHNDIILATGGGAPCFLDNFEFMKSNGRVVFLDIPLDILTERLKAHDDRPLLNTDTTLRVRLEELYNKRIAIYRQADFIVESFEKLQELVRGWR